MSCAACESKATSCTNQAESGPSRSHYTSDTEDSNMCDSGYTSDMPSGEEFISEQDECCNDNGGPCPPPKPANGNKSMCQAQNPQPCPQSKPENECCGKPQQESPPPPPKPRRCSCSAAENQQQRQASQDSSQFQQPECPRPQTQCPSPSKNSGKGQMMSQLNAPRVGSISQPYSVGAVGSNVSSRKLMAPSNSYNNYQQPASDSQVQFNSFPQTEQPSQQPACGGMACSQYGGGNQGGGNQPMSSPSYMSNGQNQGLKSCLNNHQQEVKPMPSVTSRNFCVTAQKSNGNENGCSEPEPPQPKQVVASCCYQNKSMQSLTSKNSRVRSQSNSAQGCATKATCCDKPSDSQADTFVCPSCAEFENGEDEKTCDEPEDKPQNCNSTTECGDSECGQEEANAPDCPSQFGTEHTQEKSKKKSSNSGFWQQLQFQIFQQQDGEEDEGESDKKNSGNDQYLCGSNQNDMQRLAEKPKKGGNKVWQQLTLDIFQSKEDESDEETGESNSRQGWQQQLKLQIFQEKFSSDGEEEPNADTTGNDQYVC